MRVDLLPVMYLGSSVKESHRYNNATTYKFVSLEPGSDDSTTDGFGFKFRLYTDFSGGWSKILIANFLQILINGRKKKKNMEK